MSLGTFEPEGFNFTDAGRSALLKELEEQIDTYVEEQVGEILEYMFEEDKYNRMEFEEDSACFSILHDGQYYACKTLLLAMVDNACGWGGQDDESLQKTLDTLKVAVERIEQALASRK